MLSVVDKDNSSRDILKALGILREEKGEIAIVGDASSNWVGSKDNIGPIRRELDMEHLFLVHEKLPYDRILYMLRVRA
jgi:hypothetical protein